MDDPLPAIRAYALEAASRLPAAAQPRGYARDAQRLASSDRERRVRAAAVSYIGAQRIIEARPLVLRLLTDSSYTVAGIALMALDRIDERGKRSDSAYRWAKAARMEEVGGRLKTAVWQIIGERGYP